MNQASQRPLQFGLRDLLWATTVVALFIAWLVDQQELGRMRKQNLVLAGRPLSGEIEQVWFTPSLDDRRYLDVRGSTLYRRVLMDIAMSTYMEQDATRFGEWWAADSQGY